MAEVALAFLWHQHQPYYPDDVSGANAMPWVRLHGVKDYYGMALHLLEVPEMRCTINLAPSLIKQLLAYTEQGGTDQLLRCARIPADGLKEADALLLLDTHFMASPEQMIRPYQRYAELYQYRALGRNSAKEALRRFQTRDFRDLQVWFNLAWVHPLAFEQDGNLRALRDKGKDFSEEEKNWLLDKHLEILRKVLPLHRKLQDNKQVELSTTPYYHPILPLLLDKKLAREAQPEGRLPRSTAGYPEDADVQLRRAVEQHTNLFGRAPRGLWPAEGSVCQAMLPLLHKNGIRWLATDEEILNASVPGAALRDARGHVVQPEKLYRPYKVREGDHELAIVFRDHALSDQVGFHYQRSEPLAAADDFLNRVRGIAGAIPGNAPALVNVILDGENCWEYYTGGGVAFLRALYQRCCRTQGVRPVQLSEFLDKQPPRETIPRLFAGSWINHNFSIWIGHEEDNTAWDLLHETREHLRNAATRFGTDEGKNKLSRAWEEIYIAEGSDWFWWYGEDHSSVQDELFDYLFRKHLHNVYTILGDAPPAELSRPIKRRSLRVIHTSPRALLEPKIDGKHTFFEWFHAGRYSAQNERSGAMTQAEAGKIRELYFGFSLENLYLRLDCDGPAHNVLAAFEGLRITFVHPASWEVLVAAPTRPGQSVQLRREGRPQSVEGIEVGIGPIAELAIPFARLGVEVDQPVQFFVELLQSGQSRERAPRDGTIGLARPSKDFEQIMWDV